MVVSLSMQTLLMLLCCCIVVDAAFVATVIVDDVGEANVCVAANVDDSALIASCFLYLALLLLLLHVMPHRARCCCRCIGL